MKPIRVGIIGLSSKPSAWATLAHFPYLSCSPNYTIVALCNSSVDNAKQAITVHCLPSTTKAYASASELAADPTVDLIVVSTRVDTHYAVTKPALLAGKNVFVEWPLAVSTTEARELLSLAQSSSCRAMIGLQGRVSPTILKIASLISSNALGVIHSVNIHAMSGVWQDNDTSARYAHFLDRAVGGNLLTIYGIHTLDSVCAAVGELDPDSVTPMLANLRPKMNLLNPDGTVSSEIVEKDTPDQILIQARLQRPPPAQQAVLSLHLRAGNPADYSAASTIGITTTTSLRSSPPRSTWLIYGTTAELRVVFSSASPQIGQARSMKLYTFATGEVSDIAIDDEDERFGVVGRGMKWTDLPTQGQNIGRLYAAYAAEVRREEGTGSGVVENGKGFEYPGWELALKRQELVDEIYAKGCEKQTGSPCGVTVESGGL